MPEKHLRRALAALALLAVGSLGGCRGGRARGYDAAQLIGNPGAGNAAIREYRCGACHTIPGVRLADGVVAPPLNRFSQRSFIAGRIPNSPDNLVRWIMDPLLVDSLTAMPVLGVSEREARNIAAYLYTLH